jgi:hypothetical protein
VDENTVFATLIFEVGLPVVSFTSEPCLPVLAHQMSLHVPCTSQRQGSALPHVDCFPQPIMRWTEGYYSRVFEGLRSDFRLRENGESKTDMVQARQSIQAVGLIASYPCWCAYPAVHNPPPYFVSSRLCFWRPEVWRQCSVNHWEAMATPHLVLVGLQPLAHGSIEAPQKDP